MEGGPALSPPGRATFQLVVFDLDGTLVDSRRDLAESANILLQESGCLPQSEDAIGRMVGEGAATLVARAFHAAGCDQPPSALARFLDIYNGRLLGSTAPYPGIPEVLKRLQAHATLAVLTNKPLPASRAILEGLELGQYFGGRVIGGDGPFPRKPDPAGLRHLMLSCDVSPAATLLVGDSVIDQRTARAAAVRSCIVRYGFGFDGFPPSELAEADWVVDRPLDLLGL